MTQPTAETRRSPIAALVQFGLLAGPLLAMLDASIVNVAVAPMAAELHAPLATVQAAVSGYLLALGAGLAATSYLARRLGTLPVYRASLIGFTLASAACAAVIATSFTAATRRYGPVTALHWTGALLTVLAAIAAAAAALLPGKPAETRALPAARPAVSAARRR